MWLLAMLAAPAMAQESRADFRSHIDQAKFFIRKKWYLDARIELEAAVKLSDGKLDPTAWFMLAQVCYELTDIEAARQAAKRSHTYSQTDEQLAQAANFSQYLDQQFGVIIVRAPHTGMNAELDIALTSILFDPTLKLYLGRVDAVFAGKKALLPKRFGLPAGEYTINGRAITVVANEIIGIDLLLSETSGSKSPLATLQVAQVEVSLGGGAWLGTRVSNLLPSIVTQVAYTQPFGPIIAGVMVDWSPAAYQTAGEDGVSPSSWSVGGRIGVLIPGTEPLQLRASLGYRYGYVPGIELPCQADGTDYRCAAGLEPELMVYSVGRAHIPLLEVSVDFLDRAKSQGVGFGVKGVVEQGFGTLPVSAAATTVDGQALPYFVEGERNWTATGVRFLANVSLAF